MTTCLYYWLFAPLRGDVDDSIKPSFEIDGEGPEGYSHILSLFCDKDGNPHFARLKINNLPSKKLPVELYPMLNSVQEHLIAILRFTYRPDFMLAKPSRVHFFTEEEDDSQGGVRFSVGNFGNIEFDAEMAKNMFSLSFNMREIFNLYVNGGNEMIPLQYRFISYYKILELEFKEGGFWKYKEVNDFLKQFESEFIGCGYSKKPIATINDIRDRCAHIRTGKGKAREERGVTHLNHAAAVSVAQLIPVMKAMCAAIINKHAKGEFVLNTSVSREELPGRIEASDKASGD